MNADRLETFPLSIRSARSAVPGPAVDGERVRPGDVLVDPSDRSLVVLGTGFGPTNEALALFDPDTRERLGRRKTGQRIEPADWGVRRRRLDVTTVVGPAGRRQWLGYASYVPSTARYRFEWGATALGGTFVSMDGGPLRASSPAELRTAIEREAPDRLVESADIGSCHTVKGQAKETNEVGDTGTVSTVALTTAGVEIPTGPGDALRTGGQRDPLAPGDRLVDWPATAAAPEDPVRARPSTLAAGRCAVILDQDGGRVVCHDVVSDDRRRVALAELDRRRRRARDAGVVLLLLARDCFVDPLGTGRTYSVHTYRVEGIDRATVLLAGSRWESTKPRLEHPLALSVTTFEDAAALLDGLADPERLSHPLAGWTDHHPKVAAMVDRHADRVERARRERFDPPGDGESGS